MSPTIVSLSVLLVTEVVFIICMRKKRTVTRTPYEKPDAHTATHMLRESFSLSRASWLFGSK